MAATPDVGRATLPSAISFPKHSILTLPLELFERIARYVDPEDLCSLRLVSGEAAAQVPKVYTRVHFAERAFLLQKESLETLISIASSEHFGQQIRKVVLCVDQLPHPDPENSFTGPDFIEVFDEINDDDRGDVDSMPDYWKREMAKGLPFERERHADDMDFRRLVSAFKHLVEQGIRPILHTTTASRLSRKPHAYNTLCSEADCDLQVDSEVSGSLWAEIMTALLESNIPISELDVRPRGLAVPTFEEAFGIPLYTCLRVAEVKAKTIAVFQHLRKLKLSMCEDDEYTQEFAQNDPCAKNDASNLADLFANAPLLEDLALRRNTGNEDPERCYTLGGRFCTLQFSSLTSLELDHWQIDLRDFSDFLKRQPVLERVVLHKCELSYALSHTERSTDGMAVESMAKRVRGDCVLPAVSVIKSTYSIHGLAASPFSWAHKIPADFYSSVGADVSGPETARRLVEWKGKSAVGTDYVSENE